MYNFPVRCGSLAASGRRVLIMNPEFLAGLCGPNRSPLSAGLPSQGPAPLSTWGLSFLALTGCNAQASLSRSGLHREREDECSNRERVEASSASCTRMHGVVEASRRRISQRSAQRGPFGLLSVETLNPFLGGLGLPTPGTLRPPTMKKKHLRQKHMFDYCKRVLGRKCDPRVSIYVTCAEALAKDGRKKPDGRSDRDWCHANAAYISGEPVRALDVKLRSGNNWTSKYRGDVAGDAFLSSFEWRSLRMQALRKYGARCQCCGTSPEHGAVMNVDHIKPRRKFPHLALDLNNLQVLCHECNHGKGNWDETDWRPVESGSSESEVVAMLRQIAKGG